MGEYIWLGGATTTGGFDIRGKTMTLDKKPTSVAEMKVWNFDGSSTGQAPGDDSEVLIQPKAVFKDPFRGGHHILVLTDCYKPDGTPIPTNTRCAADAAFK